MVVNWKEIILLWSLIMLLEHIIIIMPLFLTIASLLISIDNHTHSIVKIGQGEVESNFDYCVYNYSPSGREVCDWNHSIVQVPLCITLW